MKAEDCIFFQLAKASQAGTKFWATRVSAFNVTAVQAMVINFLHDCDHVTSSDLGKRTKLDSATLTGILDRLEAASLIERRQHPDDRRAIHICLTQKGKATAWELHTLMEDANADFLKELSKEEQKTLKYLLRTIRK